MSIIQYIKTIQRFIFEIIPKNTISRIHLYLDITKIKTRNQCYRILSFFSFLFVYYRIESYIEISWKGIPDSKQCYSFDISKKKKKKLNPRQD